jgi:hypothetical protein
MTKNKLQIMNTILRKPDISAPAGCVPAGAITKEVLLLP